MYLELVHRVESLLYKVGFLIQNVRGRGIRRAENKEFTLVNDLVSEQE